MHNFPEECASNSSRKLRLARRTKNISGAFIYNDEMYFSPYTSIAGVVWFYLNSTKTDLSLWLLLDNLCQYLTLLFSDNYRVFESFEDNAAQE